MKNVIERTNRFYIEMSRKVLSEKEYDVLQKLLIEKKTLQEVAGIYGVTGESVRQIYEKTYKKVKSVTQLLAEIDNYKHKLEQLKYDFKCETQQIKKGETQQIKKRKNKIETDLQKKLYKSHFPFSKRMNSMMEVLDIHTIGQLCEIPLTDFHRFKGFQKQCKKELIAFIEFESIENLFEGFSVWKTQPIQ
jgi:hypothetical protein